MSHAYGQVRFPDGLVMHFEYNGTSDVAISCLYDSAEDVCTHWREGDRWKFCTCGHDEPVQIANDYGHGQWWEARACRHCRAITAALGSNDDAYYDTGEDKYPDWWVGDVPEWIPDDHKPRRDAGEGVMTG